MSESKPKKLFGAGWLATQLHISVPALHKRIREGQVESPDHVLITGRGEHERAYSGWSQKQIDRILSS